ncbi:polymer-forming cytoskeletal protein [Actinoplanes sp. NPDC051346]|uniref:polymer-forming cytoskeletal protein n=1 Tax=Actinoplanes sp. NPDC051346 TaxID=3155048 RepID=UPI003417AB69
MDHRFARPLAGLVAAGAAALGLAAPAYADPANAVTVSLTDTLVAVGAQTPLQPVLSAERDAKFTKTAMTYELSDGLAGVSLVNPDSADCTSASPTKLTCTASWIDVGPGGVDGYLVGDLKADKTAVAGATGTVKLTFSAEGVAPVVKTAKVTVADGVDLAAGGSLEMSVEPGATFTAPLQVANAGKGPVRGVGLFFGTDYAFQATEQFSNCVYDGDRLRGCLFDQELDAGAAYELLLPYRLRKDTYAPRNVSGEFQWMTADDYRAFGEKLAADGHKFGKAGSGSALQLKPKSALRAAAAQTDVDPANNWQRLVVHATGKQGADIVAVGAKISGTAGTTVEAAVGLVNKGPATLDWSRVGSAASNAVVTIPKGSKVTTVPAGCRLVDKDDSQGDKKKVQYFCESEFLLLAGETVTWKFGLKIEKVVPNATGAVEVNPWPGDQFKKDLNRANDKAALVLNPADAQQGGKGGKGDTGGAGAGGGLPVTGPRGVTLGVTGALLVAAGAVALWLTRRRTRAEG